MRLLARAKSRRVPELLRGAAVQAYARRGLPSSQSPRSARSPSRCSGRRASMAQSAAGERSARRRQVGAWAGAEPPARLSSRPFVMFDLVAASILLSEKFSEPKKRNGRSKPSTITVERRNSVQDQERHKIARSTTTTVCNKNAAKGLNPKYILEETTGTEKGGAHDGPDIKRLIPWRQTKAQPVGGEKHHAKVQAGQTLRNVRSFQHNLSQMMRNNNRAQKQKQYKHPSNQHHTRYSNATGHISLTRAGVQYAYKQAAGRTIIQSNTASFQSYSLTSATSKALMTATYIQFSQQLTSSLG